MRDMLRCVAPAIALAIAGCAENPASTTQSDELSVPTGVYVNGVYHDVESDYIPHVVQCENGGAPYESLKAQAIAARTFLLSTTQGEAVPHIGDGQQWQVYGCGVPPGALVYSAVQATAGVFLTYNGGVANGQFVAGAVTNASCAPIYDPTSTQHYVTYNQGLTGSAVHPAPYPLGNPNNPQNRGCMGQNLANCLATSYGYDAAGILGYFYGADIVEAGGGGGGGITCPGYGDWCGSDGVSGGDASTLYHCNGAGQPPASQTSCAAGCTIEPPGTPDVCTPVLSCPGYGDWCGSDGVGGDANTLYHCYGAGQVPAWSTACADGCAVEPPGYPDVCW